MLPAVPARLHPLVEVTRAPCALRTARVAPLPRRPGAGARGGRHVRAGGRPASGPVTCLGVGRRTRPDSGIALLVAVPDAAAVRDGAFAVAVEVVAQARAGGIAVAAVHLDRVAVGVHGAPLLAGRGEHVAEGFPGGSTRAATAPIEFDFVARSLCRCHARQQGGLRRRRTRPTTGMPVGRVRAAA